MIAGFFLGAVILIAWIQNYFITRPIVMLSRATDRLSNRKYKTALPKIRDDEIGQLTSRFQVMRESIKDYEHALHDKSLYMQAIMDNVFNAIITTDTSGYIRSVNKSAEEMFQYQFEELDGKDIVEILNDPLISSNGSKTLLDALAKEGGNVAGTELTAHRKDGTQLCCNFQSRPQPWTTGMSTC